MDHHAQEDTATILSASLLTHAKVIAANKTTRDRMSPHLPQKTTDPHALEAESVSKESADFFHLALENAAMEQFPSPMVPNASKDLASRVAVWTTRSDASRGNAAMFTPRECFPKDSHAMQLLAWKRLFALVFPTTAMTLFPNLMDLSALEVFAKLEFVWKMLPRPSPPKFANLDLAATKLPTHSTPRDVLAPTIPAPLEEFVLESLPIAPDPQSQYPIIHLALTVSARTECANQSPCALLVTNAASTESMHPITPCVLTEDASSESAPSTFLASVIAATLVTKLTLLWESPMDPLVPMKLLDLLAKMDNACLCLFALAIAAEDSSQSPMTHPAITEENARAECAL
jgi:hypothetical protein